MTLPKCWLNYGPTTPNTLWRLLVRAVGSRFAGALRIDAHALAALLFGKRLELHIAVRRGEQGVVAADADVGAGIHLGTALADQDIAGKDLLAAKALYAEALAVGIAAVA